MKMMWVHVPTTNLFFYFYFSVKFWRYFFRLNWFNYVDSILICPLCSIAAISFLNIMLRHLKKMILAKSEFKNRLPLQFFFFVFFLWWIKMGGFRTNNFMLIIFSSNWLSCIQNRYIYAVCIGIIGFCFIFLC